MEPSRESPDASNSVASTHSSLNVILSSQPPTNHSSNAARVNREATPPSTQKSQHDETYSSNKPSPSVESSVRTHLLRPGAPNAGENSRSNYGPDVASSWGQTQPEAPTQGTKRCASGSVKSAPVVNSIHGTDNEKQGHSRNISVDSTASSISEVSLQPVVPTDPKHRSDNPLPKLSSQLKARLSYAMVKVQNGWENRSISEVESLASQVSSPISNASTARTPRVTPQSPRDAIASTSRRSRELSRALMQNNPTGMHQRLPNGDQSALYGQMSPANQRQNHSGHVLAPAAVITSDPTTRRRRTSTINSYTPPALSTTRLPNHVTAYSVPSSPHSLGRTATPTPQEQDAVDTLLFMSSPANSGQYPKHAHTAQPSPLRPTFPTPVRKNKAITNGVDSMHPPRLATGHSASSEDSFVVPESPRRNDDEPSAKRRSIIGGHVQTQYDVDVLLDDMAQSSEDDVEVVISPVAAGTPGRPVHVRM